MAKGVSAQEKLARARQWFIKSRSFHNKNDLEKVMCKAIGISPMICSDIIQQLLDENLIVQEKIGSANYYWCFESKVASDLNAKTQRIDKELEQVKQDIESCAIDADDPMIDVDKVKAEIAQLEKVIAKLVGKPCDKHQKNADSAGMMTEEYVARLQSMEKECIAGVNKWTDNLFALINWGQVNKKLRQ